MTRDAPAGPLEAFQGFLDALRGEGIRVSTAESVEAFRALDAVDLDDRAAVRSALRITLAKTLDERERFDRAFDRYFVPPSPAPGRKKGRGAAAGGAAAGPEGRGRGAGGERSRPKPPAPKSGGATARPRPETAPAEPHRPAAPGSRRGKTERAELLARIRRRAEEAGLRPPRFALSPEEERRRRAPASGRSRSAAVPSTPLKATRLRPVSAEEERALAAAVPRLLASMPPSPIRRRAPSERGRAWLRHAMRRSLRTGGVPFEIPRRRSRVERPTPLLLVDVSESVRRAAGLFLMLSAEVLRRAPRARVLLFVDRPVDATPEVRDWLRDRSEGADFVDLLRRLEAGGRIRLDAPSDYGTALYRLLQDYGDLLGPRTALVVLGDGRTNRFDPLPWAFEEAARRCGHVLWVVPEPRSEWGTADSALEAYLPSCSLVVEAREILDLGLAVSALRELEARARRW